MEQIVPHIGLMASRIGLNRIEKKGTSLKGFSEESTDRGTVFLHIV
jgi:hypothetical protein